MIGAGNNAIGNLTSIHCHAHMGAGIFIAGYFITKAGDEDRLRINFKDFCFGVIQLVKGKGMGPTLLLVAGKGRAIFNPSTPANPLACFTSVICGNLS